MTVSQAFVDVRVHDFIIRNNRRWLVTGVFLGALGQEDIVTMKQLDRSNGNVCKLQIQELIVPLDLIDPKDVYRRVGSDDNSVELSSSVVSIAVTR